MNSRIVNAQSVELALNRSICASFPPPAPPFPLDDAGGIVIARIDISIISYVYDIIEGAYYRETAIRPESGRFFSVISRLPRWWRLSSE